MECPRARAVLDDALVARVFPGATVEVGRANAPLWQAAVGRLHGDPDAPSCDATTIYDLASLTKVIATASFAMRRLDDGSLNLDAPVGRYLPDWGDEAHHGITIRHLLDHSSGLPAHERLWERVRGRPAYEDAIRATALERAPGAAAVYSDLGFITLGFMLEDLGAAALDVQMRALAEAIDTPALRFLPPASWRPRIAPTEFDPWRGRLLTGEVHDENAAALGGAAGHAGLFGTATDVGTFARVVLRACAGRATPLATSDAMRVFATPSTVPGSSRALGWDTMRTTSSCGRRLSAAAIGHTGFTGTSLWIDPERDLYVVLLSNRVHPTRAGTGIQAVRARFHDAVVEDLDSAR
jgi:CubicO group peptidase (beta-lactamase class C family)